MKKYAAYIVSALVVLGFVAYLLLNGQNSGSTAVNQPSNIPSDTPTTPTSTAENNTSTGSNPPATGQYKDGTYTGPVTNAIYGQLQVVATISGGKLVDTECPIQPDAPGHTTEVNQAALPQLKQEAIAAQSANINVISGATQTSDAYQQSLQAALAQAQS